MHECVNMKRFKSLTYIIIPPHIVPERRTEKVKTSTALTRGRQRKTVADKGVCVACCKDLYVHVDLVQRL